MTTYICTACGWEGEKKRQLRGSKTVEVLIWSVLLFPGPLYSLWRRTGRNHQCPHCQMPMLVKLSSAEGEFARRKFDIELGLIAKPKVETKNELTHFGNDKPAAPPVNKKPVNPDEW